MSATVHFPFIAAPLNEAAAACGVSPSTLREATDEGEVEKHYIGRKATKPVWRAVDLNEWIGSRPTARGNRTA